MARFQILNDGPDRYVLNDTDTDDPAPVFRTKEEAERRARLEEQGLRPRRVTTKRCNEAD